MAGNDYKLSTRELRKHAREQIELLLSAAMGYDGGREAEAKNLALRLRVMLHDTAAQKSVLGQLGLKDSIRFLDTCDGATIVPGNMLAEYPFVMMEMRGNGTVYKPILDMPMPFDVAFKLRAFGEWWEGPVLWHEPTQVKFSRKELVTYVANKDGGAHVDATLDEKYAKLSREHEYSFTQSNAGVESPVRPLELACVRQIAHEVLKSLHHQHPELFPPGATPLSLGARLSA